MVQNLMSLSNAVSETIMDKYTDDVEACFTGICQHFQSVARDASERITNMITSDVSTVMRRDPMFLELFQSYPECTWTFSRNIAVLSARSHRNKPCSIWRQWGNFWPNYPQIWIRWGARFERNTSTISPELEKLYWKHTSASCPILSQIWLAWYVLQRQRNRSDMHWWNTFLNHDIFLMKRRMMRK